MMIKAIDNKQIDLTEDEYQYYLELENSFGKEAFSGLFKTDKQGKIISVMPSVSGPTATILIFFFLNVMLNQRLRDIDQGLVSLKDLERRVYRLEEKVKNWC